MRAPLCMQPCRYRLCHLLWAQRPYSTSQKKVKVLAVRYGTGTLLVRSRYAAGTLQVRSRYAPGTLVVRSRYASGTLQVRSRYASGTLQVRSRYASGTLEVPSRYASGTPRVRLAVWRQRYYKDGSARSPCGGAGGVAKRGPLCYTIDVWGMDRRKPLEKTKCDNTSDRESRGNTYDRGHDDAEQQREPNTAV